MSQGGVLGKDSGVWKIGYQNTWDTYSLSWDAGAYGDKGFAYVGCPNSVLWDIFINHYPPLFQMVLSFETIQWTGFTTAAAPELSMGFSSKSMSLDRVKVPTYQEMLSNGELNVVSQMCSTQSYGGVSGVAALSNRTNTYITYKCVSPNQETVGSITSFQPLLNSSGVSLFPVARLTYEGSSGVVRTMRFINMTYTFKYMET